MQSNAPAPKRNFYLQKGGAPRAKSIFLFSLSFLPAAQTEEKATVASDIKSILFACLETFRCTYFRVIVHYGKVAPCIAIARWPLK